MKMNARFRLFLLCTVFFIIIAGIYVVGANLSPEAYEPNFTQTKLAPSTEHFFGTDALGRDVFMRTLKGLSISISIGSISSIISAAIALIIGIAAAYGTKRVDAVINWLIDLVMSVPHTVLVILISFSLGKGLEGILVGIAATHWCSLARLIRAEVLSLRNQHYVMVSKKLGKSSLWIMVHHLLPHLAPQFFVGLVLLFPHAILHEAAVSFLGFGLPPEQPAIGIILSESMKYLSAGMWWPAVFPGLMLLFTVLLIDKLGDSLRKVIDPYSAQL